MCVRVWCLGILPTIDMSTISIRSASSAESNFSEVFDSEDCALSRVLERGIS